MSTGKKHFVLIIPGLGDDTALAVKAIEILTDHWGNHGLERIIHSVFWRDGGAYEPKLLSVLKAIDDYSAKGKVSVVGLSAGGSLALESLYRRPRAVHKVVNVAGRLRKGNHQLRSLDRMSKASPAFKQSVLLFEMHEPQLTQSQRKRIMTVRPFFGDESVPRDTASLEGAQNHWIYVPEHLLCIMVSLKFSNTVLSFLTN